MSEDPIIAFECGIGRKKYTVANAIIAITLLDYSGRLDDKNEDEMWAQMSRAINTVNSNFELIAQNKREYWEFYPSMLVTYKKQGYSVRDIWTVLHETERKLRMVKFTLK